MPCAFHTERPELFIELGEGCQFSVQPHELIELDGQEWCEFHEHLRKGVRSETEKAQWDEARVKEFNEKDLGIVKAMTPD